MKLSPGFDIAADLSRQQKEQVLVPINQFLVGQEIEDVDNAGSNVEFEEDYSNLLPLHDSNYVEELGNDSNSDSNDNEQIDNEEIAELPQDAENPPVPTKETSDLLENNDEACQESRNQVY